MHGPLNAKSVILRLFFFCCGATAHIWVTLPLFEGSRSHAIRHTHTYGKSAVPGGPWVSVFRIA